MDLKEMLEPGGRGAFATASKAGIVNTAVYAVPHIVDHETLAWGMVEGRTWSNIRENPNASYAYFAQGEGYWGTRLTLVLSRTEESGELLEKIRERARTKSPVNPAAIRHVAYFKVVETRPLA
ncbi:MAG: pyridoxamine 5'-phosphate oxidase family protein [Deltaproteobacteria bacterium]|nr:pyridoxamine 5'-phosphate oxidase family protein [Deltaproteobacteria bacterium]